MPLEQIVSTTTAHQVNSNQSQDDHSPNNGLLANSITAHPLDPTSSSSQIPSASPPPPPLPTKQAYKPKIYKPEHIKFEYTSVQRPGSFTVQTPGSSNTETVDSQKITSYINAYKDKIIESINKICGTSLEEINFKIKSMDEINKEMNKGTKEGDESHSNPLGWTSPEGTIYIANNASHLNPNNEKLETDVISTFIHEAMHYSSYKHRGFQDVSDKQLNFDEAIADHFAIQVYKEIYEDEKKSDYSTNYIRTEKISKERELKFWLGNAVNFMIKDEFISEDALKSAYFLGTDIENIKSTLNSFDSDKYKKFIESCKESMPPKIATTTGKAPSRDISETNMASTSSAAGGSGSKSIDSKLKENN